MIHDLVMRKEIPLAFIWKADKKVFAEVFFVDTHPALQLRLYERLAGRRCWAMKSAPCQSSLSRMEVNP